MHAVIDRKSVETLRLRFELRNVFRREQVRQHEIAFDFELVNPFAQGQLGPIAVINT